MKIEPIIYQTTRNLVNLNDKLSISTIVLFCYSLGFKTFSDLLYTENKEKFISDLNEKYSEYEIDLTVRFNDKSIREAFRLTLSEIKLKYDKDGYLKALYDGDEFAVMINKIVDIDFDKVRFKKKMQRMSEQLKLF